MLDVQFLVPQALELEDVHVGSLLEDAALLLAPVVGGFVHPEPSSAGKKTSLNHDNKVN